MACEMEVRISLLARKNRIVSGRSLNWFIRLKKMTHFAMALPSMIFAAWEAISTSADIFARCVEEMEKGRLARGPFTRRRGDWRNCLGGAEITRAKGTGKGFLGLVLE